jgi:hypothetical protein
MTENKTLKLLNWCLDVQNNDTLDNDTQCSCQNVRLNVFEMNFSLLKVIHYVKCICA